jgi:siroheme synthase-like protein
MSSPQPTGNKENEGNQLFPVFLKLDQLHVLLVGGGVIGLEKITAILNNSPATKITLVARQVLPEITELKNKLKKLTILEKEFEVSDLDNKDLVIAATGNRLVSELIRKEASVRKILINVADTPDLCDFYLGSIVKKGDLKIAISTNGKSPTLAKRLKEIFNEELQGDDIQSTLDSLNEFRNHLKGDFAKKLKQLNDITSVLNDKNNEERKLI